MRIVLESQILMHHSSATPAMRFAFCLNQSLIDLDKGFGRVVCWERLSWNAIREAASLTAATAKSTALVVRRRVIMRDPLAIRHSRG